MRKANSAFLAQTAPTPPATTPPAGIANQGIWNGGTVGADLEELADAIAHTDAARGTATNILPNPTAWPTLRS